MAFNIGLSGIRAAATDLEVTGNNVANASTVGFKQSRAEFADVFTTTILGTGSTPVGSGVLVDNVRQEFSQGNISGTGNALDMAVDGTGFFIMNDQGSVSYTRAGVFGLDKDGFVVANSGARVQGYEANDTGVVNGVLGDLQIVIGNQPPALTSRVASILNLDASELVKQELGQRLVSNGLAIANPDSGIAADTSSTFLTVGQPTAAGTRTSYNFDAVGSIDWGTDVQFTTPNATLAMGIDLDPLDGTGIQTIAIPAVAAAATQTQMITDVLSAIQLELDTAFGINEFEATTTPVDYANALPGTVTFTLERVGFDASAGVGFGISSPTGDWTNVIGTLASATVTTATAGSNLFVGSNPLTADLRSIPGTPTTTRTVATPPLGMTDFIAGGPSTLVGTAAGPFDLSGANTLTVQVQVTDNLGTTSTTNVVFNAATGGVPAATTLAEIQAAFTAALGADVTVSQPPLTFTGAGANANGGTIALVPTVETGITLNTLGFSSSNRLNIGTADITPNNLFNIQVTGPNAADDSAAWNITVPASSYATLDDLAAAIQTEIDLLIGATGIAGRVQVEGVGGQLLFTNTEVGAGYATVLTQHSTYLPTTDAASSFSSLGFNNMFSITGTDDVDKTNSFRVNLTVPAPDTEGRSGTTTITLDEDFRSVQQVAASINRQINSLDSEAFIGVRAEAIEITPNVTPPEYKLQFVATESGEASIITITEFIASGADVTVDELYGLIQVDEDDNSLLTLGIEGVTNEYPETTVTLTDPDGVETILTIPEDSEANATASTFNRQPGVTASASTTATVTQSGYNSPGNNLRLTVNGQALTSTSLTELADEINSFFSTTLPGFDAEINDDGDLVINNTIGRDILIEITSPTVTDSIVVTGSANAGPVVLGGTATADSAVAVGGTIEFILNEGYAMSDPLPSISGIFGALTADEFEDFVINSFDPDDQETYNHATSTTIYDSLGNSHIMTQFFVKEPIDPTRPSEENIWAMYIRVDGEDVGDPDATLAFPDNLAPTSARFELFFNTDGSLDELTSGDFFITNWDPISEDGDATGALSSVNVLEGGLPLTSPANSSNFQIFLDGSTQFASSFSVTEVTQNGFTTGRLTGLEIDSDGLMFARFTNGQAQVLGQVALASFKNPEGLNPLGATSWGETFESGGATVGSPRTGTFGNLRSSSLEDSNVDLSEELVGLIIAQRNFQASAKTIETSDTVTQTIIQL